MQLAEYPPTQHVVPHEARLARKIRVSGFAAVVAVGALSALALFAEGPWATVQAPHQRPVPVKWPVMDAPAPIANEVDWSLVEVSEDPGPLAVAAYGP